jgi:chromosomal replication initiation ATPase DnaA
MRALKDILADYRDPERLAAALAEPPPPEEFHCSTCGDAHFVRYNLPHTDERFGKSFPCPNCRTPDREMVAHLGSLSGLPADTQGRHRFKTFIASPQLTEVFKYGQDFVAGKVKHPFLTISGQPGTGKTHLALAIAWEWLESRRGTVAYWQVETLLDALRSGYEHKQGENGCETYAELHFVKNCTLLVLDDLGAEKATDWSTAKLDEVIDHRYVNRLATVVTLNVIDEALPPRLADRLYEGANFVLDVPSFRRRRQRSAR